MLLVVSLLLPWRSKRPYGPSQHNLNIYGMNILCNCMMFSTAHYDSFSWMLLIYFTVIGNLSVRWFSVFCFCLGLGGILKFLWLHHFWRFLAKLIAARGVWHRSTFFWSTLQTWFSKMSGRCGQDEDLLILCLNLNLHHPSISHLN